MLAACLAIDARAQTATAARLELDLRLDPAQRMLHAGGRLVLPPGPPQDVYLRADGDVRRLAVNGRPMQATRVRVGAASVLHWRIDAQSSASSTVEFSYAMPLQALDPRLDHRAVLGLETPLAGPEGVFVPSVSTWHPTAPSVAATHRISILTPRGIRALVPGRLLEEAESDAGQRVVFESLRPLAGIDLLAGPYVVAERQLALDGNRRVRVRTYFHAELQELVAPYLDAASRHIARYDRAIGPYAHPDYSVVSSPLPTGFGMPGIAYLGRQVLRLPFIRETSLGHEVLHDWWGNGVYPDYARGNWAEGLTTFMADYAFREDESPQAARGMREGWLRDYAAVPPARDRPLSAFVARRHGADQALGYNKTAFVFFMLRDRIGPQAFSQGVRAFWRQHAGAVASWQDLRDAFERAAAADLGWFFEQWIERAGAPMPEIASARSVPEAADGERLEVRLRQSAPAYRLRVPLRVELHDGRVLDLAADLDAEQAQAAFRLPGRARYVSLDPDARLFRRVSPEESAATLRPIMLDPRTQVVLGHDPQGRRSALRVADAVLEQGVRTATPGRVDAGAPVLVAALSAEVPELLRRLGLPPVPDPLADAAGAYAYAGRSATGRPFAVVTAPDAEALAAVARPLPHLGAQSYALFEGGRSVRRGIWPASVRRVAVEAGMPSPRRTGQ